MDFLEHACHCSRYVNSDITDAIGPALSLHLCLIFTCCAGIFEIKALRNLLCINLCTERVIGITVSDRFNTDRNQQQYQSLL